MYVCVYMNASSLPKNIQDTLCGRNRLGVGACHELRVPQVHPCSVCAGVRSHKAGSSLQVGITIIPLSSEQILGGKLRIWSKSSCNHSYWLEWALEHVLSHSVLLIPCYFPFPTPSFLFWCNVKDFWETQKGKAYYNLKFEHFLLVFNAYIQHFILKDLL